MVIEVMQLEKEVRTLLSLARLKDATRKTTDGRTDLQTRRLV
jgi:hypothetical protein